MAAATERAAIAAGAAYRPTFAGWLRIGIRLFALVATLLALLPLHYVWRAVVYGSPFPKLFLKNAARIAGARVTIHGAPLRRDVFFVANHLSWIDILALAGASGTAFVAKAELGEVPVIGWLCSLNRTVFVSRENRMGVAAQIDALKEALADNWSVTVFPEGTTTDGHSLLPFKTSMLRVLEPPPAGVRVQPVMLDYGALAEWIGWVGDEGGLDNAKRVLARPGSFTLHLYFLDPFDPFDYPGRKAIAAEARARIEAKLAATLGKPLRPFAYDVEPVRFSAQASQSQGPSQAQDEPL